jgi:hypothetical protein
VTPASRAFDLPVFRRVQIPVSEAPRLHVVIDTEEEFDWHAPFARENTRAMSTGYSAFLTGSASFRLMRAIIPW